VRLVGASGVRAAEPASSPAGRTARSGDQEYVGDSAHGRLVDLVIKRRVGSTVELNKDVRVPASEISTKENLNLRDSCVRRYVVEGEPAICRIPNKLWVGSVEAGCVVKGLGIDRSRRPGGHQCWTEQVRSGFVSGERIPGGVVVTCAFDALGAVFVARVLGRRRGSHEAARGHADHASDDHQQVQSSHVSRLRPFRGGPLSLKTLAPHGTTGTASGFGM